MPILIAVWAFSSPASANCRITSVRKIVRNIFRDSIGNSLPAIGSKPLATPGETMGFASLNPSYRIRLVPQGHHLLTHPATTAEEMGFGLPPYSLLPGFGGKTDNLERGIVLIRFLPSNPTNSTMALMTTEAWRLRVYQPTLRKNNFYPRLRPISLKEALNGHQQSK